MPRLEMLGLLSAQVGQSGAGRLFYLTPTLLSMYPFGLQRNDDVEQRVQGLEHPLSDLLLQGRILDDGATVAMQDPYEVCVAFGSHDRDGPTPEPAAHGLMPRRRPERAAAGS